MDRRSEWGMKRALEAVTWDGVKLVSAPDGHLVGCDTCYTGKSYIDARRAAIRHADSPQHQAAVRRKSERG